MARRILIGLFFTTLLLTELSAQVYDHAEPELHALGRTDAFVLETDIGVYYPQHLEEQAVWVIECTRYVLSEVEAVLDYRLNGIIEIYLNDLRDGRSCESCINIMQQRVQPGLSGGIAEVNHKQFTLQYTGSYPKLHADLRLQVANTLVNELIYGVSVAEKARNTANIHFPEWFEFGLKAYLAEGWTAQDDQRYRDVLLGEQKGFLSNAKAPEFVQKSLWHFITETKGTNGLSRFVYLSRLTKSIQSSLYFVFNLSYSEFVRDAEQWHLKRYLNEKRAVNPGRLTALPRSIAKAHITDMMLAGDTVWLSVLKDQKAELWRFNEVGGWKRFKRIQGVLSVHFFESQGGLFALVRKFKGYEILTLNDARFPSEWQSFFEGFSFIADVCADDGGTLWCSGYQDGPYVDVYQYKSGSEPIRLTFDSDEEKGLNIGANKELYFIKKKLLLEPQGPKLSYAIERLNDSFQNILIELEGSEIRDLHYDQSGGKIYFLSDLSGAGNAYALGSDSGRLYALTDYAHNLEFQSFDPLSRQVAELLHMNGKWVLSVSGYDTKETLSGSPRLSIWKQTQIQRRASGVQHKQHFILKSDRLMVPDTLPFLYQSDFPETDHDSAHAQRTNQDEAAVFRLTINRPAMTVKEVYTRFDNGLLDIERQSVLLTPAINYRYSFKLMGGGFWTDPSMLRQFTMVLRVETQLSGSDQLFRYQEHFGRFYAGSELYRQMFRNGIFLQGYERYNTLQMRTYGGLNVGVRSKIECTLLGRQDGRFNLVTDQSSLNNEEISNLRRLVFELEYRNKWVDENRRLRHSFALFAHGGRTNGTLGSGNLAEFGFSAKKQFFAGDHLRFLLRAESAVSVGKRKTVFIMGGVANWVNQYYNTNREMLLEDAIAFSILPGVRGTRQNARNGNAFANLQLEGDLRIVSLISKREVLNPSLRNLRIGLFTDAGAAWYGNGPYDPKNPFFISRITAPGVDINLYQRRNPFLLSAGWMLQIPVYRYQLQFSSGRALEDDKIQQRVFALSVGYLF